MSIFEGTVIKGQYRVKRLLGEGATSKVWLVEDLREQGASWALKQILLSTLDKAERQEVLDPLLAETSLLQSLSHPGLPQLKDCFFEQEDFILVLERVTGPTLRLILDENESLKVAQVIEWSLKLCEILKYLHSIDPPIVYRDLKPENVMVHLNGQVRLVDFGIARIHRSDRPGDTAVFGTPGYAPPEQLAGQSSFRSDIYALGVMMFVLLTKSVPYSLEFGPFSLKSKRANIPSSLDSLIAAMTESNPERRPVSIKQVQEELQKIQAQESQGRGFFGFIRSWLSSV